MSNNIGVPQLGWTLITPELAKQWLEERNKVNRRIRASWVKYLAGQILAGRWERVTDAIGFRTDGMLINGQHRLLAIVEAGQAVEILVVGGLSENAFHVIDRGVPRTLADALKLPNAIVSDARAAWQLLYTSGARIPEDDVADTAGWWSPAYDAMTIGVKLSKGVSSAPVRVGFGVRWAVQGTAAGRAYVREQYHALQRGDTDRMSRVVTALWKRLIQSTKRSGGAPGRLTSSDIQELAVLCWHTVDPVRANSNMSIIKTKDGLPGLKAALSKMEEAFLAAPRDAAHPYLFGRDVAQRRVAARKDMGPGRGQPQPEIF